MTQVLVIRRGYLSENRTAGPHQSASHVPKSCSELSHIIFTNLDKVKIEEYYAVPCFQKVVAFGTN